MNGERRKPFISTLLTPRQFSSKEEKAMTQGEGEKKDDVARSWMMLVSSCG